MKLLILGGFLGSGNRDRRTYATRNDDFNRTDGMRY